MKYCFAIWNNLWLWNILSTAKIWNKINPLYATAYFIALAISYPQDISQIRKDLFHWKKHFRRSAFFLAPQTGLEPVTPRLTAACSASWAIEAYLIFMTRTCDTLGQKHSRLTRLERFVILLVFSYSMSWLFVHRTVKTSRQLTAVCQLSYWGIK